MRSSVSWPLKLQSSADTANDVIWWASATCSCGLPCLIFIRLFACNCQLPLAMHLQQHDMMMVQFRMQLDQFLMTQEGWSLLDQMRHCGLALTHCTWPTTCAHCSRIAYLLWLRQNRAPWSSVAALVGLVPTIQKALANDHDKSQELGGGQCSPRQNVLGT